MSFSNYIKINPWNFPDSLHKVAVAQRLKIDGNDFLWKSLLWFLYQNLR